MRIDCHVHVQPHGESPPVDRAAIERYVACARAAGVDVVVFTEHVFRFHEAYALLEGWWDADPSPQLAAITQGYWQDHVNLSLPAYVRLIEAAKADGLPVRLGLELDWIPGRADALRRILAPYAWDVVLGSVHWVGAMPIDEDAGLPEWRRRGVERVWAEYTQCIEDLCDARLTDVIAHPDLAKVYGYRPADEAAYGARIVAAAARTGTALEINTKGLRNPVGEVYPHPTLLRAAHAADVPITLASDAHVPERVGMWFDQGVALARAAGYDSYRSFEGRVSRVVPLP